MRARTEPPQPRGSAVRGTGQLQTPDMEEIMVETVLAPWEILLVIFAAVLVMSVLMLLPPAAVVIWRMRHVPQISLQGSV
nr:small integral membrane protein 3-like [Zonotrichia albicollis]